MFLSTCRAAAACGLLLLAGWSAPPASSTPPVKIILETDMESDFDDAGALAILHALADRGECEILSVMHNTSDEYGAAVIDAINTYYGRGDLPIGVYRRNDAPSAQFGGRMRYAQALAMNPRFPKDVVSRRDAQDAVALYKRILSKAPDRSVVIVSVGWAINLGNLLRDREGADLIRRRVKRLVLMGGGWDPPDTPHTAAMNLAGNQVIPPAFEAGKYVVDHWPTPIVFSGLSIGGRVQTGEGLKRTPESNPVREVYRLATEKHGQSSWNHASWDQTAVLFAVRGKETLWRLNMQGTPRMFLKPNVERRFLRWATLWDSSADSRHAYLRFAAHPGEVAREIERLMVQPPARK